MDTLSEMESGVPRGELYEVDLEVPGELDCVRRSSGEYPSSFMYSLN